MDCSLVFTVKYSLKSRKNRQLHGESVINGSMWLARESHRVAGGAENGGGGQGWAPARLCEFYVLAKEAVRHRSVEFRKRGF